MSVDFYATEGAKLPGSQQNGAAHHFLSLSARKVIARCALGLILFRSRKGGCRAERGDLVQRDVEHQ
ncbi:MAG: hypothetical protein WCB27_02000, partial [Thermoguttaceae bacterium]